MKEEYNTFSNTSKPKIVKIGQILHNDSVEIINFDTTLESDIIKLNPDLIISDRGLEVPHLMEAPISLRKKWMDSSSNLHSDAIMNALIKDNRLISVFTSSYNIKSGIYETYESLRRQTYSNWEWVIVDDSDDDGETLKVIRSISDNDYRVKTYSFDIKSGGCIGESKYRAAMLCSGEYLVELDHDDILTEDCLELIVRAFEENPEYGFVSSDVTEVDENGNSLVYPNGFSFGYSHHYNYYYDDKLYIPYTSPELNPQTIRHIVGVPNHVRAWRSNLYRYIGGHNRKMRIADDYELIIRTFLNTKFMRIPKMLYIQKMNGKNSQDSSDNRKDIQIRVREIANFYSHSIKTRFEQLGGVDYCYGVPLEVVYSTVYKDAPNYCKILSI